MVAEFQVAHAVAGQEAVVGVGLRRGDRPDGQVAVDDLQRVLSWERHPAGEHLVEGDAERVEVGAVVGRPVGASGLLGRQVGQGALEGRAALLRRGEAGGQAEVAELDHPGVEVDEHVGRLDVLVDHLGGVDLPEDVGQRGGGAQEGLDLHSLLADDRRQRQPAEVLEHEADPVPEPLDAEGMDDPGQAQLAGDVVLLTQPGDVLGRRVLTGQELDDHRRAVGAAPGADEHGPRALAECLDHLVAVELQLHSPASTPPRPAKTTADRRSSPP